MIRWRFARTVRVAVALAAGLIAWGCERLGNAPAAANVGSYDLHFVRNELSQYWVFRFTNRGDQPVTLNLRPTQSGSTDMLDYPDFDVGCTLAGSPQAFQPLLKALVHFTEKPRSYEVRIGESVELAIPTLPIDSGDRICRLQFIDSKGTAYVSGGFASALVGVR